jgi:hypothetical protein
MHYVVLLEEVREHACCAEGVYVRCYEDDDGGGGGEWGAAVGLEDVDVSLGIRGAGGGGEVRGWEVHHRSGWEQRAEVNDRRDLSRCHLHTSRHVTQLLVVHVTGRQCVRIRISADDDIRSTSKLLSTYIRSSHSTFTSIGMKAKGFASLSSDIDF